MADPWAAPDWQPEPALGPAAARPGLVTAGGRTGPPDRPELPVPLRRLTMADRLDGALRILKLAPTTVLAVTAAAVAPFEVLAAGALHGEDDPFVRTFLGAPFTALVTDDTGSGAAAPILFLYLDTVVIAFVAVGMASLLGAWHLGRRPSTGTVLRQAAARLPALLVAMFLVHLLEVLFGVVAAFPAVVPMVLLSVVSPVIGSEGVGPFAALRRSYRLTRSSWGNVLGTSVLVAVACSILRLALGAAASLYVGLEWPGEWAVATVVSVAARLVTVPLVAGASVLLYLDLRVHHEGLDIDLAIDERLPRAG